VADFAPEHFVVCISNHDQAGNRLLGDRFHHGIDTANYRALSLFHCLVPYTPLIFMGQEFGSSSPFLYFTDMSEELGILIAEGRRRDFLSSNFAKDENELTKMSHPQEVQTFQRSKIDWAELEDNEHRRLFRLYRDALKFRREWFGGRNPGRDCWTVEKHGKSSVGIHYRLEKGAIGVYLNFESGAPGQPKNAPVLLRSNAEDYAGPAAPDSVETVVVKEG
jgi:maltooligosyltrehalose trehalohydrolase